MNDRCRYSGYCGWSYYGAYCPIHPDHYQDCVRYKKYEERELIGDLPDTDILLEKKLVEDER